MQAGEVRPRASAAAPVGRLGVERKPPAGDARTRARAAREHVAVAARQGCGYNAGVVSPAFEGP